MKKRIQKILSLTLTTLMLIGTLAVCFPLAVSAEGEGEGEGEGETTLPTLNQLGDNVINGITCSLFVPEEAPTEQR